MVSIGANQNRIAYGIKHYNADHESDRLSINTFNITPGSTVFVIENSKHYMLNNKKEWIEINLFGNGSSNGNTGSGDNDSGDGFYDGGDLDA